MKTILVTHIFFSNGVVAAMDSIYLLSLDLNKPELDFPNEFLT
jgi:hypothetical protein